ncbi:hypothetical protein C8Q79DRAFT_903751 [Trametes meyenii]|nr:hypothetical protein C8Q79DRAFT_903751 [Trametes meyenii]
MAVPVLDDDVLRQVFSYLHGRDALRVALCSKRLYDLSHPRIPAVATCQSPEDLQRLHRYMTSGPEPRARYLEDFTIALPTFDYPRQTRVNFSDYWDFSQVHLIGDLLSRAQRIRRLSFERLHPCLDADPRIGPALAAMDQLVYAEFATVADGTFARLPQLGKALRCLRLSYVWDEDDALDVLEDETKTLPPLVAALTPLYRLHTLDLWNFTPPLGGASAAVARLPSIRELRLTTASVGALELVGMCPGLTSLDFSLGSGEVEGRMAPGPRWPPLRSLRLAKYREISCVVDQVSKADRLEISENVVIRTGRGDEVGALFPLLAAASPVSLSLVVTVGSVPMEFFAHVPPLTPLLQSLELSLSLTELTAENEHWLDNVPDALCALPIVFLSLVIKRTPTAQGPQRTAEDALEGLELTRKHWAEVKRLEEHRSESIAALPERLASTIPTLRFLSIAAAEPNKSNLHGQGPPKMEGSLLRLDDDALLLILSYTYGENALNIALTCKRLHNLATPRVASRAKCSQPKTFLRLCDYMLMPYSGTSSVRAKYVQVLIITSSVVEEDEDLDDDFGRLANVLSEARGLRELRCFVPLENRQCYHQIRDALLSLNCLTTLELTGVSDDTVSALCELVTIKTLVLHYRAAANPENTLVQERQATTLFVLFKTLSNLRQLTKLEVHSFDPPPMPYRPQLNGVPPLLSQFESITDISLIGISPNVLPIVQHCPSLATLAISAISHSLHQASPDHTNGSPSTSHTRWPALRRFSISTWDLELCGIDRFGTARELYIEDEPFENRLAPAPLSRALPILAPLVLSVTSRFSVGVSLAWKTLSSNTPDWSGVRLMDITVNPPGYKPWSEQWPDHVAPSLSHLPLLGLRMAIYIPAYSWRARVEDTGMREVALGGDESNSMRAAQRRKKILSTLPLRLFNVLSTLRVFAIAEEVSVGKSLQHLTGVGLGAKADREYMNAEIPAVGPNARPRQVRWDALDWTRFQPHWWCRSVNLGTPTRVTEKEGERAYRCVEDVCSSGSTPPSDLMRESLLHLLISSILNSLYHCCVCCAELVSSMSI